MHLLTIYYEQPPHLSIVHNLYDKVPEDDKYQSYHLSGSNMIFIISFSRTITLDKYETLEKRMCCRTVGKSYIIYRFSKESIDSQVQSSLCSGATKLGLEGDLVTMEGGRCATEIGSGHL
jgi:hypothetical protein